MGKDLSSSPKELLHQVGGVTGHGGHGTGLRTHPMTFQIIFTLPG